MARKSLSEILGGKTRFGRLTVVSEAPPVRHRDGKDKYRRVRRAQCACECGGIKIASVSALKKGHVKSCGCIRKEINKRLSARGAAACRTHGESRTPAYVSWTHMRQRCLNKDALNYERYGGRGIKICERWRDDFAAFLADMGERPEGTTLDRIDVDGDYEPGNCRWSTPKEQQANQRRHKRAVG